MIDLLGTDDKKLVLKEYRKRLILGYGFSLCLVFLISIISIASFYGALLIEKRSLEQTLASESAGVGAKEFDMFTDQVGQANRMIKTIVEDRQNVHSATVVLDEVLKVRPRAVRIFSFDLAKAEANTWSFKLSGKSARRQELLSFTNDLKKSALFQKVDSPFSNLIKDTNSDFSVILTVVPSATSSSNR